MANRRGEEDEIYIYTGGRAPLNVTRVRIDESVTEINDFAFVCCVGLLEVETHDGITNIGKSAFQQCQSLIRINLLGVKVIEQFAFSGCIRLTVVEFSGTLERIGAFSFHGCESLRSVNLPSLRVLEEYAFSDCTGLTDVGLPEGLEEIKDGAFSSCKSLKRITMPSFGATSDVVLKDCFYGCGALSTVVFPGVIHRTVATLHLESWRNQMNEKISKIDQYLATLHNSGSSFLDPGCISPIVEEWMQSILSQVVHYKVEHSKLLNAAMAILELALWKANLDGDGIEEGVIATRGQRKKARKEGRITSGASIVINNVLPFLELERGRGRDR